MEYFYTDRGLPYSIFTREYEPGVSSTFMASTHRYSYDSAGNILRETKPNGETITYTYGQYAIPLTKTWRQNADTTIVQTNTLTADQKAIAETTVSANGAVQSKAAYTYDARGRVTEIAQYLSASEHITQQFAYDNSAAATQITTLQVKTADGEPAVSTPGSAAGSITEKTSYNDRGLPTGCTDGNGNTTTYTYNAAGNVTSITYPDGCSKQYAYDFANRTTEHTDPVGNTTVYQYNVFGQLVKVSDKATGQVLESFRYDSLGRLNQRTEQRYGSVTTTEYDERDRLLSETVTDSEGALLSQTLYSYDILSSAPAADTVQPHYIYTGSNNNAVSVVTKTVVGDDAAPSIVTTQYTDRNGDVVRTGKVLDGTEYLDTYTYDFCGNLLTHLSAQDTAGGLAYSEKYTYNAAGQVVKSYNALGQYTTSGYDWLGRMISSTDYAGTPTTYAYDALGRLLRQTVTVQDGITAVTKYDYDAAGNIIREWTPKNAVGEAAAWAKTEYGYDSRDRLVSVRQYNGSEIAVETTYTYDGAGRMLSTTTGGSTTAYTYDRFGNVLTATDALGQSETNVYSSTGALLRSTDRAEQVSVYTYDALGRVLSTVANGEEVCYTYTKTGQLCTEENAASCIVFTYDELGRLIEAEQTDKAPEPDDEADPLPQPEPEPEPADSCTVTLNYNDDSEPTLIEVVYGSSFTLPTPLRTGYKFVRWSSGEAYYPAGTVLTITQDITLVAQWIASTSTFPIEPIEPEVPAGPIQPGDPIPLDPVIPPVETMSLVAEEDGCVSTCTYAYDLAGNRTRFTLVLGETAVQDVSYTYDVLNRLLTVSENGELQATYTYDTNGNRAGLTYANGVVTTYTYNAANWVTSLQNTRNGETISGFTYTYYASGSQKSKTDHHGTVTTYVYDDLNRLVQESEAGGQTVNYAYDVRGNRTQQTVTGSASYTVSYTYDAANRLISSTTGSQRTTYTYDPQGLRLSKQTGDTRTVFLSDGGNVAAEVVNGQLTATYLRGANLISRNEEYYLFNAHGDVVNLTSASGAVTKTYAYDAFGNEKNPDEADANPFRYCGEYFDSETGTYYLRARYYDPAIGRFTQADTHWNVSNMIYGDNPQKISEREDALGLKTYTCAPQISAIMQSGNLYVYCVSDPVNGADPTGRQYVEAKADCIFMPGINYAAWGDGFGRNLGASAAIAYMLLLPFMHNPSVTQAELSPTYSADTYSIDWDSYKEHILHGSRPHHGHDWSKFGVEPDNNDDNNWKVILPILEEVVNNPDEVKNTVHHGGQTIVYYSKYFADVGQEVIVKFCDMGDGILKFSNAYPVR